jgi:predicted Holliday junction resolvase-like endonuclease
MSGEQIAIIVLGIIVIGLLGIIVIQMWFIKTLSENFDIKEKDLLNRVMARNFETFVQSEVVLNQENRPLTAEEIYEQQIERGIPV